MPSFLAIALVSGVVCAGLHALAMSGVAVFGGLLFLLVPVPLYYAALAAGSVAGLVAAGTATVGVALLKGGVSALVFLALWGLPAACAGVLAVKVGAEPGKRLSRALEGLSAWGVSLLMLGAAFMGGVTGMASPAPKIASFLDARVLEASSQMSLSPEVVSEMFRSLSGVLPGFGGMMWLLLMFASVVLAQRLAFRKGEGAAWDSGMAGLRLPRWMLPVFVAAAFVGLLGQGLAGFVGVNLACFFLVPFLVDGLGVVHALLGRRDSRGKVWIWFLYGSLLVFNVLAIPVAGLGMMDQRNGFRRKLAEKFAGRENE